MFERSRLFLLSFALVVALSVSGATAATTQEDNRADAQTALSALSTARNSLNQATAAVTAAEAAVVRIRDRSVAPEEEPPPSEGPQNPTWIGDSLSKYAVVQPRDGSITMANGIITFKTTDNTGVGISGNPRDEIISPNAHKTNNHWFVGFAVRFPGTAANREGLPKFSGGGTFNLFYQLFGMPADGSPPLSAQWNEHGTRVGAEYNARYSWAWPWTRPFPGYDTWIAVTEEVSTAAINQPAMVRTWLDGVLVFEREMVVYEDSDREGVTARLLNYRKKGVYAGTITTEFKPLAEGPTRASVEYH